MNWLHYLLEANIYLSVFYLLYFVFLDKETHYKLNRAYLLTTCIIAYIIPVIQIGVLKPRLDVENDRIIPRVAAEVSNFTLQDGILSAYVLGVLIMVVILTLKCIQLIRLTNAQNDLLNDRYKLVKVEGSNTAFSFFNYVFIGTKVNGVETIIRHELVHINQKHSVDIVFLEVIKIINWFNPFIYLLQLSLKTVHEYIADEQTAAYENDALTYSSFLVDNAYGISGSPITHSFFNYNLLKKRIIMLNQKRSGNLARLKYLLTVPVCMALLCVSTLGFSKNYGWFDVIPAKKTAAIKIIENKNQKPANNQVVKRDTGKKIPPPPPPAPPKPRKVKFPKPVVKKDIAPVAPAHPKVDQVKLPPNIKKDKVPPPPPPVPPKVLKTDTNP